MSAYLTMFRFGNEDEAKAHPIVSQWWTGESWHAGVTIPNVTVAILNGDGSKTVLPYWYIEIGSYEPVQEWMDDPACMAVVDIMGPSKGESKEDYIVYLISPLTKSDMLTKYLIEPMPW